MWVCEQDAARRKGFIQPRAVEKSKAKGITKDDRGNINEALERSRKACPGHTDSAELSDFYKEKMVKSILKHFNDLSGLEYR